MMSAISRWESQLLLLLNNQLSISFVLIEIVFFLSLSTSLLKFQFRFRHYVEDAKLSLENIDLRCGHIEISPASNHLLLIEIDLFVRLNLSLSLALFMRLSEVFLVIAGEMKVGRRINHDIAHSPIDFLIISLTLSCPIVSFCPSYIHLHLTYWHIRERTIAIEWKKSGEGGRRGKRKKL